MSPITIPFLRRPYQDNRVILTVDGTTRITDIPDIEEMLSTDGHARMKPDGYFRLSKSGNTIYAELPDVKTKPLTSQCTQMWKLADYLADICMSILGKPPEGYEISLTSATEARLQKAIDQRAGYNQDAYKRARQSELEAYA
jgi:hypothetical protein